MKTENKEILIYSESLAILWEKFISLFKIKAAGGGVVKNSKQEILIIKRRGLWDLPKGHQEKNEDIEATAIREVSEECGIENIRIVKPILITYHTYWLNNKAILKPTHWFEMIYTGNKTGIPQSEEEITELKWFNINQLEVVYSNTFPSIIDVIQNYCEGLEF